MKQASGKADGRRQNGAAGRSFAWPDVQKASLLGRTPLRSLDVTALLVDGSGLLHLLADNQFVDAER